MVRQRAAERRHRRRIPRRRHHQTHPHHQRLHAEPEHRHLPVRPSAPTKLQRRQPQATPPAASTLATKTLTIVSALDCIQWDADDITQSITGSLAFRYGVYYKARGGASSADELIGYVDFGSQTITSATLTINQADPLTITAS